MRRAEPVLRGPDFFVDEVCSEEGISQTIVGGYTAAAAEAGARILPCRGDAHHQAIFRAQQRRPAYVGRVLRQDEIKAVVTYQGRQFVMEDYFVNAISGIDDLAWKIGWMTFQKLSE